MNAKTKWLTEETGTYDAFTDKAIAFDNREIVRSM